MDKKEEIISAMTRLFSEKGYNTSMSELAKEVRLKVPSIYSHYTSKDEIISIAVKKQVEDYYHLLNQEFIKAKDKFGEDKLKHIYYYVIDYFKVNKLIHFYKNIFSIQEESLRKKCRNMIIKYEKESFKNFNDIFKEAVSDENIRITNVEGSILLYFTMIQGTLEGLLFYEGQNLEIEAYVTRIWDAYWQGIKSRN